MITQRRCGCGAFCDLAMMEGSTGEFLAERTGELRVIHINRRGVHVVVPVLREHICPPQPAPIQAPTRVALGGASAIAVDDVGTERLVEWAGEGEGE